EVVPKEIAITATDRDVVILGGGDTGSDCIGTSHRQRARSVTSIELLPQPPVGRHASEPWPQAKKYYFNGSSSHEEGGTRDYAPRRDERARRMRSRRLPSRAVARGVGAVGGPRGRSLCGHVSPGKQSSPVAQRSRLAASGASRRRGFDRRMRRSFLDGFRRDSVRCSWRWGVPFRTSILR